MWTFSDCEDSFSSEISVKTEKNENHPKNVKSIILNSQNLKLEGDSTCEIKSNMINELLISTEINQKIDIDMSVDDCCEIIRNVFFAASEREISVGDGVNIWIIRSNNYDNDEEMKNKLNNEKIITIEKSNINLNVDNKNNNKNNNKNENGNPKIPTNDANMADLNISSNEEDKIEIKDSTHLMKKMDDTKKVSFLPTSGKTSKKILKKKNEKNLGKNGSFTIEKRNFKLPNH